MAIWSYGDDYDDDDENDENDDDDNNNDVTQYARLCSFNNIQLKCYCSQWTIKVFDEMMASFEFEYVRTIATDFLEYISVRMMNERMNERKRENKKAKQQQKTSQRQLEWVNEKKKKNRIE